MVRVDVYTFVEEKGELLKTFPSVDEAIAFARPLSLIPGNKIGFVVFSNGRPVDLMVFWGLAASLPLGRAGRALGYLWEINPQAH